MSTNSPFYVSWALPLAVIVSVYPRCLVAFLLKGRPTLAVGNKFTAVQLSWPCRVGQIFRESPRGAALYIPQPVNSKNSKVCGKHTNWSHRLALAAYCSCWTACNIWCGTFKGLTSSSTVMFSSSMETAIAEVALSPIQFSPLLSPYF